MTLNSQNDEQMGMVWSSWTYSLAGKWSLTKYSPKYNTTHW